MASRPPEVLELAPEFGALAALAPTLASACVTVASDLALLVDAEGVIRHVAVARGDSPLPAAARWSGQAWTDTVTEDSRRKIEQLIAEARVLGHTRRREVTLLSADGQHIPVAFAAIRLGDHGPLLAVGRDLRPAAEQQRRFLQTQREMERDYWKRRQTEARYRLLFQVAADAVLVVDAVSRCVSEANRAAIALFGVAAGQLAGRPAASLFAATDRAAVDGLLLSAYTHGRASELRTAGGDGTWSVSATPFQSDGVPLVLLSVRSADDSTPASVTRLAAMIGQMPDGMVIVDDRGRVQLANPAFLALAGVRHDEAIAGRPLSDWIGRAPRDLGDLCALMRRAASASRVVMPLRADAAGHVEISGVLMPEERSAPAGFGLTLRRIAPDASADDAAGDALGSAIAQLSERVGRQILPMLMREGADLVERHLLQIAMARGDGEAAAARLLGISEQSLALRLARHGLRDGDDGSPLPVAH